MFLIDVFRTVYYLQGKQKETRYIVEQISYKDKNKRNFVHIKHISQMEKAANSVSRYLKNIF